MTNSSTTRTVAAGASPEGASDANSAAAAVRQMFNSIAPRYDLLNHVLSANIDRLWWWRTARRFRAILANPNAAVLDICCGTGDMTMALLKRRTPGSRPVIAADFAHQMLARGARKFARSFERHGSAIPLEADALHLPLQSGSLDLVTTAFGFRNLANYREGLIEFRRVLRPGGQLGILDFSEPEGLLGKLYHFYFHRVLPAIGRLICGKDGPYNYLPASVQKFPPPPAMLAMMREAGFTSVSWIPYTFGIAGLYIGTRSQD
ncbi:ubiquinone/menaquinone biosynthesis methyltransferase [Acidicapsa dinghuensis]|uniref:Demethylmenaquinone methyltransferase n=1 Tax=Acidicapsa dinghuensis TaxID=2218256 RepID=A0ABW1ENR4_9BACT|nr:ubiquinone/menaquinone biosynthesis methyltransferase [Acidicapsa dinghuensis]